MLDRRTRGAVALGGGVGTAARALVVELLPVAPDGTVEGFPWGTFTANITGALLLGFVVARVPVRRRDAAFAGLTTGMLGAYTTFSTFVLEVRDLVAAAPVTAVVYGVGSVALGLVVAEAGRRAGDRLRVAAPRGVAR